MSYHQTMGIFDFLRGRGSGQGSIQAPEAVSPRSDTLAERSAFDEVGMNLSQREYRHAIRLLQPGYELDVHAVLRGEPVVGLPLSDRRGPRSVYGVLLELDNGNILMIRHRAEEGDALGIMSAREAKGQVVRTEGKNFRITIGSELKDSFGVDRTAQVCGIRIIGGRLHPSEYGMYHEDSVVDTYKALILNPEKKVMCEHLTTGAIEEAYVKTSTGNIYRLSSGGDGTVAAESAFHKAHQEQFMFTVRMESFHVGQKLTMSQSGMLSKMFETAKIIEFATSRPGAQPDENFAVLQRGFTLQADPNLEDKTSPIVDVGR